MPILQTNHVRLKNYADVHQALEAYISRPGVRLHTHTLENMQQLMAALGNPQDAFKAVHIAGTSGKTSTSYYVAALLAQAGRRVGLTVSPHVDEINERVQLNVQPLNEREFCQHFSEFLNVIAPLEIVVNYFEVITAFAYWLFAKLEVEYAVIEVGIGGLLDSTNVMTRQDKVCVITDIGFDHMELLGKTLPEIAAQKAGIIQEHNLVYSYRQSNEIGHVLQEAATRQRAELHEVLSSSASIQFPAALPLFQQRNWYLARQVFEGVCVRDGLPELTPKQYAAAIHTYIPGRMEIVTVGAKTVVLDGAHNAQKLETLVASMRASYDGQQVAVLADLRHGKDENVLSALQVLAEFSSHIILTIVGEDTSKRSRIAAQCADYLESTGSKHHQFEADYHKAYQWLLERPEPVVLVTGSLYFVGAIKKLMQEQRVALVDV